MYRKKIPLYTFPYDIGRANESMISSQIMRSCYYYIPWLSIILFKLLVNCLLQRVPLCPEAWLYIHICVRIHAYFFFSFQLNRENLTVIVISCYGDEEKKFTFIIWHEMRRWRRQSEMRENYVIYSNCSKSPFSGYLLFVNL
jgi:hypothetical protein